MPGKTPIWLRAVRLVAAVGIVLGIEVTCFYIPKIHNTTVTYLLLLAILYFAVNWEGFETITAALVAALGFDMLFQIPVGSLQIRDPESWVAVVAFLITAIIVSRLTLRARHRTEEADARRREAEQLYELGQMLLSSDSLQAAAYGAAHHFLPVFGAKACAVSLSGTGEMVRAGQADALTLADLNDCALEDCGCWDAARSLTVLPIRAGEQEVGRLAAVGVYLPETTRKALIRLLAEVAGRVQASGKLLDEKRRSESLLLNILPSGVAEELRSHGMVSPKYFEDVTILFTDFVGFTLATEQLAAEELVQMLHEYFTAFDRIVERYGLEKMKTIGDSYMCLCGLPKRNPAHPVDTVMAAFEMLQAVKEREQRCKTPWRVRIGVHTGPVIAGVVGINKFAFDIWGDTVNYSSRMESSGQPNRINLSERTYSRVKDFFDCEYRGKVLTKEKRELDMYFANGMLPVLNDHLSSGIPGPFRRRYHVYFQKEPPAFPHFLTSPQTADLSPLLLATESSLVKTAV